MENTTKELSIRNCASHWLSGNFLEHPELQVYCCTNIGTALYSLQAAMRSF
jgi:hypothetical protein